MDVHALEAVFRRYQRTGDPEDLALVFDQAAEPLARLARHLATREADTEDLIQLTFLTVIEKARAHDARRDVLPWLIGILSLHAREARRRGARRPDPRRVAAEASVDAAVEAERHELAEELARSVEGLPPPYRPVLRLLLAGLDAEEIARRLRRAPGTVRVQLARGAALLGRALPAGLVFGLGGALDAAGLERVRARVLERAARAGPPFSAAPASSGVLLMTARTKIAAVSLLIAALIGLLPRLTTRTDAPDAPDAALEATTLLDPRGASAASEMHAGAAHEGRLAREDAPRAASDSAPPAAPTRFDLELLVQRGAGGPPLVDAGVRLARPDRGQDLLGAGDEQRTDAQGRAHFHDLEPGAYVVHLDRRAGAGMVQVPEERTHTVVVPPGMRIAGRVVGPDGTPVAGARVLAHGNLLWPAEVAHTDAAGAFRIDDLAPYLLLEAVHDGFVPSMPLEVRADAFAVELALRPRGRSLAGTVQTPEGLPSGNAFVVLQPVGPGTAGQDGPRSGAQFTRASGEGRFSFAAVPAGSVRVVAVPAARDPLVAGAIRVEAGASDQEVVVALRRGAVVEGRVLDALDGRVPSSLVVSARALSPVDDLGPLAPWLGGRSASVDENGAFHLSGLVPGSHELVLSAGSESLASTTVALDEGASERWDVRIDAQPALEVRVEPPVPPADRYWGLWMLAVMRPAPGGSHSIETLVALPAQGRLAFPALEGGPFTVALTANLASVHSSRVTLATQTEAWPGDELSFRVEELPSARARGSVLATDGSPLAGARILVRTSDTLPASYVDSVTDAEGHFLVDGLPPGHYVLELSGARRAEFDLAAGEERDLGALGTD